MSTCPQPLESWHLNVGVGIAILGIVGILVPWFRSQGRPAEKAAWTLLMFALLGTELYSIHIDQAQHRQEQAITLCEQTNRFEGIAVTLERDINANRDYFEKTMDKESYILGTAKSINELSRIDLAQVTGGKSFAYVVPIDVAAERGYLFLVNDGKQVLSGISVEILRVAKECPEGSIADGTCLEVLDQKPAEPTNMGSLGPHEAKDIPTLIYFNTAHYRVYISAQNGKVVEDLWFRPLEVAGHYEFRFSAKRQVFEMSSDGNQIQRVGYQDLKKADWTKSRRDEPRYNLPLNGNSHAHRE